MATRIPQSFIDDVLDRVDITEVIDRRVPLKKSGRNYMACCPFHDEKTPSFSVNTDKQFYYCFGCGAGGNAIGFLMDYERLDFPQALEQLAESIGLEVPREQTASPETTTQKRNIYSLLERAAQYYEQQLKSHPKRQLAIDYLKGRGLDGETAQHFNIGYAPPGWDNLLKALATNEEERQLLIDGGMLIDKPEEQKCYDRFRDRIMFPIRDNRGRVIAFGGRVLGDDKPKYLNSPETAVFHKNRELYGLYQARKSERQLNRLLVVEGYMDVVALSQCGISWAAATLGTATSTEHLKLIFRQCPEVIFCFDGDEAGTKAAKRALESALPAMEDGRQARFLFLPEGEDPDTLIRKVGSGEFERLVDQTAKPLETFLFETQSEDLNLSTMEGKARLSLLVTPLIQRLPEGVFKTLMLSELSKQTGLSIDQLSDITPQTPPPQPIDIPQNTAKPEQYSPSQRTPKQRQSLPPATDIRRNAVLYAIGLLILYPRCASRVDTYQPASNATEEQLLHDIIALIQKRPDATTYTLLGNWLEAPWKPFIEHALNQAQLFGEESHANNPEQELIDTLNHIQQHHQDLSLDSEIDQLASIDYQQQSPEQKQRLAQLLREKHNLLHEKHHS